jgi:hypothetical protein
MKDGVVNCSFTWISNTSSGSGAYIQYKWSSAKTIGSMYIHANTCANSACSHNGRTFESGDIQYLSGNTWVTATTVSGKDGDFEVNFVPPLNTTGLRVMNAQAGGCGQTSNTMIYEWLVRSGQNCGP